MEKSVNRNEIADKLEAYFRDRIELSNNARFSSSIRTINMDSLVESFDKAGYDGICSLNESVANYTRLNEEEVNQLLSYVREFILKYDITFFPYSNGSECSFLISVFKRLIEDAIVAKDPRLPEIVKYFKVVVAMRNVLICPQLSGTYFRTPSFVSFSDNKGKEFINYSNDKIKLDDFTPMFYCDDIYDFSISDLSAGDSKSIVGIKNGKYLKSLIDDETVFIDDKSVSFRGFRFHSILSNCGVPFLKQEFYSSSEFKKIFETLKKYRNMSSEELEKLEQLINAVAEWWFDAHLNSLNDYRRIKKLSPAEISEAQKNIYVSTLSSSLKRDLLCNEMFTVMKSGENEYNRSLQNAYEALKSVGVDFEYFVSATVVIKDGCAKLGHSDYYIYKPYGLKKV